MNELCNGRPSEETVQFLRSLERPLDAPSEEITRLFGTNFDTCVINQDMLEEMPGEMFFFKSKDEGIYKVYLNPKSQVNYCHHLASVVRLLTFFLNLLI